MDVAPFGLFLPVRSLTCLWSGLCNCEAPFCSLTLPGLSPGCHTITHLDRPGSAEGTGLVKLCCSWRKTTGILGRRSGSGVCSIKSKSQGSRGHHIPTAGTLQRHGGHFSCSPGSASNWNCTPFSTGFPSGPPIDLDTWSWSFLALPGHLSIKRGSERCQVVEGRLSSHFS